MTKNMERNKMSKKVLVLSASPRKGGNSDLLCDQFIAWSKRSRQSGRDNFPRR